MKFHVLVFLFLGFLASCAAVKRQPLEMPQPRDAVEEAQLELVFASKATGDMLSRLRIEEAGHKRVLTGVQVTIFLDRDGDRKLTARDQVLDTACSRTTTPSWFVELSGLSRPSGKSILLLAEVTTICGSSSSVVTL